MNYGILSRRFYTALYLMSSTRWRWWWWSVWVGSVCHMMVMKRIIDNSRVCLMFTAIRDNDRDCEWGPWLGDILHCLPTYHFPQQNRTTINSKVPRLYICTLRPLEWYQVQYGRWDISAQTVTCCELLQNNKAGLYLVDISTPSLLSLVSPSKEWSEETDFYLFDAAQMFVVKFLIY